MQLGNVTTDAAKDYGITYARQQYNASLPATIKSGAGEQVPNPALVASDAAYLLARIGTDAQRQLEAHQATAAAPAAEGT